MKYEKLLNDLLNETDFAPFTVPYEKLLAGIPNINQNIEIMRKAKRLHKTKFANLLDISIVQLTYYQKYLFPIEILKRITTVLEISIEDLIIGKTLNVSNDELLERFIKELPASEYMYAFQNKVNISYAELAKKIGIDEETLYNCISTNRITLFLLKQIAISFDISVESILFSNTDLYKNISVFRILNGYSTTELSELANVSYIIFSPSYLNKKVPNICLLKKLADALNVSLYQMATNVPNDIERLVLDKKKLLEKFSKNLKLYLQLHNISQKEVAEGTFLTPETICDIANGRTFRITNVRLIVKYLNTSILDIILFT